MTIYYRLLDSKYHGMIIRSKDGEDERYDPCSKSWIGTGVMIRYFSDESEAYDMYEEISEAEVKNYIQQK